MKKLFCILILLASFTVSSQEIYNLDKPKTEQDLIKTATKTNDLAIYKGKQSTVYQSKNGKLFIIVESKNGKLYKKYI
jgi:hypothetical protein